MHFLLTGIATLFIPDAKGHLKGSSISVLRQCIMLMSNFILLYNFINAHRLIPSFKVCLTDKFSTGGGCIMNTFHYIFRN